MNTWRVAWHLLRWKVALALLIALCGYWAGTEKFSFVWLWALGVGAFLLSREAHDHRALRMLPITSSGYTAMFWVANIGSVASIFALGGLISVLAVPGGRDRYVTLVMAWALLITFHALTLVLSYNPLRPVLRRFTNGVHYPWPSLAMASAAWLVTLGVAGMMVQMLTRVDETHSVGRIPFNIPISVFALMLMVGTYLFRKQVLASTLYPADFSNGSQVSTIVARGKVREQGSGWTYLQLAWGAVVWIAVAAVIAFVLSGLLPLSGAPFNLAAFTFYMSRLMLIVGLYPTVCVASMAPLRTLRTLPLTCRQLVLRILGYFFVPWIPILPAIMALLIWRNGNWTIVATFSLMYAGAGIVSIGISSFFQWSSSLGIISIAFLAQLALLIGIASTDMPLAENSTMTFIAMSIIYALLGLALLHHAIVRSSRAYRAMRR